MPNFDTSCIQYYDTATASWVTVEKATKDCNISYGIQGNDIKSRVARFGTLKFKVLNIGSTYDVGNIFEKGTQVRALFGYETTEQVKIVGYVHTAMPMRGFPEYTQVIARDLMFKIQDKLNVPALAEDKDLVDVAELVLDNLDITPLDTEYNTCNSEFESVFDTTEKKTAGTTLLSQVAMAELGFAYVKGSNTYGEVFTVDGRDTRAARNFEVIQVAKEESPRLLLSTGDILAVNDGTEQSEFVLSSVETLFGQTTFIESILALNPDRRGLQLNNGNYLQLNSSTSQITINKIYDIYGEDVKNIIRVDSYPRSIDTSVQILYTLKTTMRINVGETKEVKGRYTDPNQEAQTIAGKEMVTPVSTTDYTANSQSDGLGTDLTSDLDVTVTYGATDMKYILENTGATDLYVTLLQARGKGIYLYNKDESESRDEASIAAYGQQELIISQKYIFDPDTAQELADDILEKKSEPKVKINKIEFSPIDNWRNMQAFLRLEVGSPIKVFEISSTIKHYIQAITVAISDRDIKTTYLLMHEDDSEV